MGSQSSGEFVEIFCGIGGFAEALGTTRRIHVAVDINRNAIAVYRLNYPHPVACKTIESLSPRETEHWSDKTWWISPPCQPYTRRGKKNDVDDPRSLAFLNVLQLVDAHRPPALALENVPEFAGSRGHAQLIRVLNQLGYYVRETTLCPTEFGFLNKRNRFYLVAALASLKPWQPIKFDEQQPTLVESQPALNELLVSASVAKKFEKSLNVVTLGQTAKSACFTSAYGRSPVRSGSYLLTTSGLRRFSPREILWQLGFGRDYVLPDWPYSKLWPLVGNSLSIPAVQYIISHLPHNCKASVTTSNSGWHQLR